MYYIQNISSISLKEVNFFTLVESKKVLLIFGENYKYQVLWYFIGISQSILSYA